MVLDFKFYVKAILIILLLNSCKENVVVKTTTIFDFQKFFTDEMALLNSSHIGLNKNITDKENVYSNIDESPDWTKELAAFRTFSLIKPEQVSAYSADTLISERGFKFITYSADNPELKLQLAEVMYNPDNKVEKITLVVKSEAKINNSDITLTYLPGKGYDIKGDINSKISGDNLIDVHVECN